MKIDHPFTPKSVGSTKCKRCMYAESAHPEKIGSLPSEELMAKLMPNIKRSQADEAIFSDAAMRAQDGKTVPLKNGVDGPTIGSAIVRYRDGELFAEMFVTDPEVQKFLNGPKPPGV